MKKFFPVFIVFSAFFLFGCLLDFPGDKDNDSPDSVVGVINGNETKFAELVKGTNYLEIPDGKTLYTLSINVPDDYGTGGSKDVNMTGSSFKGVSKKLIPDNPEDEELLKTTRTDVYVNGDNNPKKVSYLGENKVNKILYFIETDSYEQSRNPLLYTAKDGTESSIYVDYENKIIPKLDEKLSYAVLQEERELYSLKEYDVDHSGFFHVIFNDFGDESAEYTETDGSPGAYGISGAYVPNQLYSGNEADVFYVNTRFTDILIKNWTEFLRREYEDSFLVERHLDENGLYDHAVSSIFGVFIHEYFHYLMDAYLHFECSGQNLVQGPLFWIEGMAESTSYIVRGAEKNEHSGFVKEWLSNPENYRIAIRKGDENVEKDACVNYVVAPMFFLFLKEKYGIEVLEKFAKYRTPNDNLNTIVYNCVEESFGSLYRDFILTVFSSVCTGSNELSFLEDWSVNGKNIASCREMTSDYTGNIGSGCFSLVKWVDNPTELEVDTDCDCYAFFL